jgi:sterol desaturase/sphingolipid hydroxylase (fatty acid hydroxylase superfamily)
MNFAVHFPLFDRLFGTYHLPADGRWPQGYGIQNKIPKGFLRQLLHPFRRNKPKPPNVPSP